MERRQIAAAVGAGLFTTGGAALWQSLNPALDANTVMAVRVAATFGLATGLAIFGVLFVTARSAKAEIRRQMAIREQLGGYLNECRGFTLRCEQEQSPGESLQLEIASWWGGVQTYVTKELGSSYMAELTNPIGLPPSWNTKGGALAGGMRTFAARLAQLLARL